MTEPLANATAFCAALVGMEALAWATHRWVMHGPLWVLHRSHHEPRSGAFERNDLFAVFFAALAIALFWWGAATRNDLAGWSAAGITTYGLLYALFHDGLVHRRWPMPGVRRGGYLGRLVRAHRLHHAVRSREGAVAFGFLWPADTRRLVARLRRQQQQRGGRGPRAARP